MTGIEQYLNLNRIPLVVGIPWHGYDYTCELKTAVSGSFSNHMLCCTVL